METLVVGDPLDKNTDVGAINSKEQLDTINKYIKIGLDEGATMHQAKCNIPKKGYFCAPTIFTDVAQSSTIVKEEIFGPVVSVTTFKDEAEALAIANDTEYGLGAGVWTRDANLAYRMGRSIEAGRIWVNCYHAYPAHAAFGGYKKSGIGRETHKMMLDHYQNTKNLLISYDTNPLGFF